MIIIEPIPVTDAVLASSNVAASEPAYNPATSYALAYIVSSANILYESLAAGNLGNALTDVTKWLPRGATNQRKMFDALNNTQTVNADSIVVTLTPTLIANGFYLGNLDADSVTVTVTDAIDGVVFNETQSLIQSNSGSGFFNWFFKRIARKTVVASVLLPMYAGATITITISKPGGIAKCGMCVIGPVVDVGLSQYGLGTDIKDYSTVRFNVDGTSATVERGYSKRMTLDIILDNDVIDVAQDTLAGYRQTPVVWIGSTLYGSTLIYGKYSSFKNVIEYPRESRMALQIEGMI